MTGTAKLFLRSTTLNSWQEFKAKLLEEFDVCPSHSEVMDMLRNRHKKSSETLQQYVLTMQEIGSMGNIAEKDVMRYIINGIPDSSGGKTILYTADNLAELKRALKKYELVSRMQTGDNTSTVKESDMKGKRKFNSFSSSKNDSSAEAGKTATPEEKPRRKFSDRGPRCYNCGANGHYSNSCTQPRNQRTSHYGGAKCEKRSTDENATMNILQTVLNSDDAANGNQFQFELSYEFVTADKDGETLDLITLLDTGSPVSLIQEQFLKCRYDKVDPNKFFFYGVNRSRLGVRGVINCRVTFKNEVLNCKLFVVQNNSISFPVILGRDFCAAGK